MELQGEVSPGDWGKVGLSLAIVPRHIDFKYDSLVLLEMLKAKSLILL